jgi:hypothetical protein
MGDVYSVYRNALVMNEWMAKNWPNAKPIDTDQFIQPRKSIKLKKEGLKDDSVQHRGDALQG